MWHHLNDEGSIFQPSIRINNCSRLFRILKLILHIELILFIGWSVWILHSSYNRGNQSNSVNQVTIEDNQHDVLDVVEMRRMKRNLNGPKLEHEECISKSNVLKDRFISFSNEVIGETSNETKTYIIDSFLGRVLTVYMPHVTAANETNEEEWKSIMHEIDEELTKTPDTIPDGQQLPAFSSLSEDSKTKLRGLLQTLALLFNVQCRDLMAEIGEPGDTTRNRTLAELIKRDNCAKGLNADVLELEREECISKMNVLKDRLISFSNEVIGETSNETKKYIIDSFVGRILTVSIPRITAANETNEEEWQSIMHEIDEELAQTPDTIPDGQQLPAFGSLSEDSKTKLRGILETLALLYNVQCKTLMAEIGEPGDTTGNRTVAELIKRDNCISKMNVLEDRFFSFSNEVVGETSNDIKKYILDSFVGRILTVSIPRITAANETNEKEWQSIMHEIDEELAKTPDTIPDGQQLPAFSPLSEDSKTKLRGILESLALIYNVQCKTLMAEIGERGDTTQKRTSGKLIKRDNSAQGLNADVPKIDREECISKMNETEDKLSAFSIEAIGETSDVNKDLIIESFLEKVLGVSIPRIIFKNETTEEEWGIIMHEIDEELARPPDRNPDGKLLPAFSSLSQDSKTKLRGILETIALFYNGQCRTVIAELASSGIETWNLTSSDLIKRDNCVKGLNVTQEKFQVLAKIIVPGEASDPLVAAQRLKVETLVASIVTNMLLTTTDDSPITNVTDAEWRAKALKLKHDVLLAHSNQPNNQQNTDENDAATQQMAENLRDIVVWKIAENPTCDKFLQVTNTSRDLVAELEDLFAIKGRRHRS